MKSALVVVGKTSHKITANSFLVPHLKDRSLSILDPLTLPRTAIKAMMMRKCTGGCIPRFSFCVIDGITAKNGD